MGSVIANLFANKELKDAHPLHLHDVRHLPTGSPYPGTGS